MQPTIEFTSEDFEAAWNNAPALLNQDPNHFRLCYICKYYLQKHLADHLVTDQDGFNWTLDLINAKKPRLTQDNYIAVHLNCVPNRAQLDSRKQLKRIQKTPWLFDEEWLKTQN